MTSPGCICLEQTEKSWCAVHFDALTIDTQTVFHSGFRFESGLLAQLGQFKSGPTSFIMTEVVFREIRNHLIVKTRDASEALQSAREKAARYQLPVTDIDEKSASDLDAEAATAAEERLKKFIDACGAKIIDHQTVSLAEVMERYFKAAPPFATSGKKKNEFPDAVSLLSLEAWAKETSKVILAVTNDGDWKAFADHSKHIYVVNDLGEALQKVQDNLEETRRQVGKVFDAIATRSNIELAEEFESSLSSEVNRLSVVAEATSYHYVESDGSDLEFLDFSFHTDEEGWSFDVVRIDGEAVTVRAEVSVRVTVTAEFSLSAFDSIDRDYVGLGSTEVEREEDLSLDVLVTLTGLEGEAVLEDVELIKGWVDVNFGEIEMDYGDYEE